MASRQLLVAAFLVNILSSEWIAQASGMSAKEFFDQVNKNLLAVVSKAQENDLNRCGKLLKKTHALPDKYGVFLFGCTLAYLAIVHSLSTPRKSIMGLGMSAAS